MKSRVTTGTNVNSGGCHASGIVILRGKVYILIGSRGL